MNGPLHSALRAIPSVESVLRDPLIADAVSALPQPVVVTVVREVLDSVRSDTRISGLPPGREAVMRRVRRTLDLYLAGRPARVVNATGVILHTNLGRAVLGERLALRLADVARTYSDLELDVETGERGRRESQTELLLRAATGAESALVVNNCAAAVLLLLGTFAEGREVVVSRGELVEIGGAFRIPDVLARSGARMIEVGTTNKTKLSDYRAAVTPDTAVLLKVHTSNFRVVGFTEEVTTAELSALARELDLIMIRDLGSGSPGLPDSPVPPDEPTLAGEIRAGADLVAASGDKLLGGPQAGVILGRRDLVRRAATNPLYRALRPDKLTIAALSEAILIHLEGRATEDLPALRMLGRSPDSVAGEAARIADAMTARLGDRARITVESSSSETGGGSLPVTPIPTSVVSVTPADVPAHRVEAALRRAHPPVLVRVQEGRLLIDPRTLLSGEAEIVVDRLVSAIHGESARPGTVSGEDPGGEPS